ncbi:hypothetical protein B0H12DRAFT_1242961 [Mycena haematopus]|nr:hypothetical protein B0H12DRAFT_1242961 [Mycena haematopus]
MFMILLPASEPQPQRLFLNFYFYPRILVGPQLIIDHPSPSSPACAMRAGFSWSFMPPLPLSCPPARLTDHFLPRRLHPNEPQLVTATQESSPDSQSKAAKPVLCKHDGSESQGCFYVRAFLGALPLHSRRRTQTAPSPSPVPKVEEIVKRKQMSSNNATDAAPRGGRGGDMHRAAGEEGALRTRATAVTPHDLDVAVLPLQRCLTWLPPTSSPPHPPDEDTEAALCLLSAPAPERRARARAAGSAHALPVPTTSQKTTCLRLTASRIPLDRIAPFPSNNGGGAHIGYMCSASTRCPVVEEEGCA